MIDLHTHTKHSDGTDSTIELLQNAQKIKVNYLLQTIILAVLIKN